MGIKKILLYKNGDTDKKEIMIGSAISLTIRIAGALLAFLMNLIVARNLGIKEAGIFLFSWTLMNILSVASRLGTDNLLMRFVASNNKISTRVASYFYVLKKILLFSSVISLITFLLRDQIGYYFLNGFTDLRILSYFSLSIIFFSFVQMNSFFFQGLKCVGWSSLFNKCTIPFIFLLFICLLNVRNASEAAFFYCISTIISSILVIIVLVTKINYRYFIRRKKVIFDFSAISNSITVMYSIQIFSIINQYYSSIVIGLFLSPADVAIFSTSQKTAMLTSFILVAVNSISAPKFAQAYKKNNIYLLEKFVRSSNRLMISVAVPIEFLIVIFSKNIMTIFGEEFSSGFLCLIILSLGQFVNVVSGSVGYLLQMTDNERIYRKNMLISSAINLLFTPLFAFFFGLLGAAFVTSLAIATQNILCLYKIRRILGINMLYGIK